jgi:hypothetical protein
MPSMRCENLKHAIMGPLTLRSSSKSKSLSGSKSIAEIRFEPITADQTRLHALLGPEKRL